MKRTLSLVMMLVFALTMMAFADDNKGNQTKCPVMGGDINKEVFTDYKGYRVYFCCAGCDKKFEAEPKKYLEKLKADGVKLHEVADQSSCPVSGEKLKSKDSYVDVEGKRVYVCCDGCKAKVKEDPATYLKKIYEKGETAEKLKK